MEKAEVLKEQLEHLGSEEAFEINQKVVSKERIFFEICYWKNSLLHLLNPHHRFNCLAFQLPNYGIFNFIEQYLLNPGDLFTGLSQNEVACVFHEPSLFTSDTVKQVQGMMNSNHLPHTIESYTKLSQLLLFQVSKKVKLSGLTLENDFFEIFNEIKTLFQIYQLLHYYCILYRKLPPRDLESNFKYRKSFNVLDIYLYSKNSNQDLSKENQLIPNSILIGIEIEKKTLSVSIDPKNGNVDFDFEFLNKDVQIYKSKFQVNFHLGLLI